MSLEDRFSEPKNMKAIIEAFKAEIRANMESPYIYTREGLCDYLGTGDYKPCTKTIERWEKAGIVKAYKKGRKIFYKKTEIEQSMIPLTD